MNYLEALTYLKETDFYFTIDKYDTLSVERKEELLLKRKNARDIVSQFQENEKNIKFDTIIIKDEIDA